VREAYPTGPCRLCVIVTAVDGLMEYLRCKSSQAVQCFIPGKRRTHGKHSKYTITNKTCPAGSFFPPARRAAFGPGVLCICLFSGGEFAPLVVPAHISSGTV
jgi:hypothetical protein